MCVVVIRVDSWGGHAFATGSFTCAPCALFSLWFRIARGEPSPLWKMLPHLSPDGVIVHVGAPFVERKENSPDSPGPHLNLAQELANSGCLLRLGRFPAARSQLYSRPRGMLSGSRLWFRRHFGYLPPPLKAMPETNLAKRQISIFPHLSIVRFPFLGRWSKSVIISIVIFFRD